MSYYRYITGIYKSYWPELNRTLRSSSSPRHIPEPVPCKYCRVEVVSILSLSESQFQIVWSAPPPFLQQSSTPTLTLLAESLLSPSMRDLSPCPDNSSTLTTTDVWSLLLERPVLKGHIILLII